MKNNPGYIDFYMTHFDSYEVRVTLIFIMFIWS